MKTALPETKLKFEKEDLVPISVSQYLKNSLHNKGLHYDSVNQEKEFSIDQYNFAFKHNDPVKISWDHIKALLIANSELLYKIIGTPLVSTLPAFSDKNVVILRDQ